MWAVTLVLDGQDGILLSRELSCKAAVARAEAEIREGGLGECTSLGTTGPGCVKFSFPGGLLVVQQEPEGEAV